MSRALLFLLGAVSTVACAVVPEAVKADPYESCDARTIGEPCGRGPTVCHEAPVFEYSAAMCTTACDDDADCVARADFEVRCEQFTDARLCVVACHGSDADCPLGTDCRVEERVNGEPVSFCAPD